MKKKKHRMLFVGPELKEIGGVSFYCKAILEAYPGEAEYFQFPLSMSRRPFLFLKVLADFSRKLSNAHKTVHLNTSLNLNALARDFFFCVLALAKGKRPIVFIHGWDMDFQESLTGVKRLVFRGVFNRSALIIVLSQKFKDILECWNFTCPIEVETTCFPSELRKAPTVQASGIKNPRVLFLSRIVKEKGVFELADACAGLTESFPGLRLDIAGEGPDLHEFNLYITRKGYDFVAFHGNVTGEEKNCLFSEASVFCLPTYYGEGLPITIIEAMYFGLPIITTGAGGIAEIFKDNENGLLVKPRDIDDLKEKLTIIFIDNTLTKKISERNTEYAKKRFSPKVVASRLAVLHERCVI